MRGGFYLCRGGAGPRATVPHLLAKRSGSIFGSWITAPGRLRRSAPASAPKDETGRRPAAEASRCAVHVEPNWKNGRRKAETRRPKAESRNLTSNRRTREIRENLLLRLTFRVFRVLRG